ncbi:AarF/ABC1/UbiB kinase family protein [Bacillus taeanensis]|uniref:AarF/ABC1/UbiB kinase family protein n=2 Tax=Bacillus taeanensis TaxID=273032 RepID=A0A366XY31_9BACI|nr:AarF/ABC1/UbiB kinase family protein [Bacillus taeanensis]
MWKILSMAFLTFITVYSYKLRKKPEAEWVKLWEKIGGDFRKTLFELEGLLIKVGQLLSIRSDLLPNAFISQIQDLVDKVPPSPWPEIKKILEQEWNGPIENTLLFIHPEAVASASIGEVYQGVLKNGKKVAIKVQRPNIASIVQTDFRTLAIVIWLAHHFAPIPKRFINFKMLFKELKQVIERELDFTKEMEASLSFQERFKNNHDIRIPKVYQEFSTSKVLVMEWVEGVKITDVDALDALKISRKELAQRLIGVFLPQWLEAGIFHADPHAGNVLVGSDGKIILLDFGMVGDISKKDAANFQTLIEALLAKNYSKAVNCFSQLGFLLPDAETKTIEHLLAEMMSYHPSQLKEMDLLSVKKEMNDLVQALPIQVPTRFAFLGRAFVTIEGILYTIAPHEELIEVGKPVFLEWVKDQGKNKWSFVLSWLNAQPLFKLLHSAAEFLETPQRLEKLKETEQRRSFTFTIYENQKKQLFQLSFLGVLGTLAGIYMNHTLIWQISLGTAGLSIISYFICSHKQRKWLKHMPKKRKG